MLRQGRHSSAAQSGMFLISRCSTPSSKVLNSSSVIHRSSKCLSTKVAKTAYQITNNDLYKQHIRKTVPFDTNLKSLFVLTYPSTRVLQLALPQPTDRIHEIAELNSDAILPAELASFCSRAPAEIRTDQALLCCCIWGLTFEFSGCRRKSAGTNG